MAKRTIRRNPLSVDVKSLDEKYFNFAQFGGINSNKNYVGVNQYSFEDANNVYVDQNSQLHTRPPIKSLTIEALPVGETPIDIVKVNNITFYKTYDNTTYRYRFKYNEQWYSVQTTEKSLVYFINDTFIFFNSDSIVAYQYQNGQLTLLTGDIVYTPITKIVQGSSVEEFESPNLLTAAEITRYLFEYGDSIPASAIDLIGQTVTVTVGDETYTIELQAGSPVTFVSKLSKIDILPNLLKVYTSDSLIVLFDGTLLYASIDGVIFSIYNLPNDVDEDTVTLTVSKDGTQIICATNVITKEYAETDNEGNPDTTSKFQYKTTCYYMNNPFINTDTGWKAVDVVLLEGYDDPLTSVSENVGKMYNTALRDSGGEDFYSGYSTVFTGIGTIRDTHTSAFQQNDFVIVYKAQINLSIYKYTENYLSFNFATGYKNTSKDLIIIVRVFVKDNLLTYSVDIGAAQNSQRYNTPTNPYLQQSLVMNVKSIDYVVTNGYKFVVFDCTDEFYVPLYTSITPFYDITTFVRHCIMYHCIDADDNMLHSVACTPNDENSANIIGAYTYVNANFVDADLIVLPSILNTFYAMNFNYAYNINLKGGKARAPFTINVEDIALNLIDVPKPHNANYQNAYLTFTVVGNKYISQFDTDGTSIYSFNGKIEVVTSYTNQYDDKIDYNNAAGFSNIQPIRLNYPVGMYLDAQQKIITNQCNFEELLLTTEYKDTIAILYNSDVLTPNFYYHQGIIYPLLTNCYPVYVGNETLDNGKIYGKILYYNPDNQYLYTNEFDGYATVDIVTEGTVNYIVPNFAEDFITTTIVLDNLIYQSQNRFTEATDDNPEHISLYFPIDSKVTFVDKITNLVVFSQTSLGVFLEDLVYEYQYNTDNDAYTLTPTKMQLGCIDGADILIGYDGSTIFMTQLKGLAGLSYQDFVQSTEQVYTYLTEAIMDLYDDFKGDRKIKLYQYKDWLFMYKQDTTILYILDTRSATWWKWTLPYAPQRILYDGDNLLLLINNQIAIFDFETNAFDDFVGTEIKWHFRSQKLHFDAPNNYKHIRQLNVITSEEGTELRYKLKFKNYRNLNNLSDTDTVLFDIDQLTTLIKRVNFVKTNAFQFEIANDETDPHPKLFETPDIVIKYRITEAVR